MDRLQRVAAVLNRTASAVKFVLITGTALALAVSVVEAQTDGAKDQRVESSPSIRGGLRPCRRTDDVARGMLVARPAQVRRGDQTQ